MFQIHMHARPIADYRSAYASPEESAAVHRLQREMLIRGVIISNKGFGFISTVMNEADLEEMAASFRASLQVLSLGGNR